MQQSNIAWHKFFEVIMQDKADFVVDSCESIADKLFNAINHAKDPNKTALIVKKERCSYANLRDRSFSLAALLAYFD